MYVVTHAADSQVACASENDQEVTAQLLLQDTNNVIEEYITCDNDA